ncbi:MAG: hypothetical protein IT379_31235 [Deltaproteobacteria bacterium]|nr:hypothetical protein [Deltaproteobacteria bacterium]
MGKAYCLDEQMRSVPWTFSGFRDVADGQRLPQSRLMTLLVRFLLEHRLHELRLLPEDAFESVPTDAVEFIEDADRYLKAALTPEPGDGEETALARPIAERFGVADE